MAAYPTDYRGWLAKLISFDTVSSKSNLDLIHYVRDYLQSVGVTDTHIIPAPDDKIHANLFATLPGEGGVKQGGIVLSGHSDVVPVDGQKWDSDPFTMVEKDGKLYGRGTGDMKGFLAIILALVPTFLQMQRKKPVHIAFSYGEEVGCTGAPVMTKYLQERNFSAEACVIGEPTHMLVYTGNKGYVQWRFKVTGKSIHSSMALMNTSVNAIEYGAFLIAKIREITVDLRENGPRDKEFDCPFSSITTGLIKGGVAVNTVPADCEFTITARLVESKLGDEIERKIRAHIDDVILPQMREEFPEASIDMVKEASYPAFHGDEHDRLTLKAREMLGDHDIHKTGGGTEAGIFLRDLKVPTIICGPGHASQAHVANEYVAVDKMDESMKFTLELTKFYVE